jgi:hypothetical protein
MAIFKSQQRHLSLPKRPRALGFVLGMTNPVEMRKKCLGK